MRPAKSTIYMTNMDFFGFLRGATRPATEQMPRIYAIGDIHGRMDLLERLIGVIERDAFGRSRRSTRIIVLGDFIDRGPRSADVVALLMQLRKETNLVVLKGNHEAAMVDALDGNFDALDLWLAHGGLATLASFGVDVEALDLDDTSHVLRVMRAAVPRECRKWLRHLPTHVSFGRYYFVHAGIKPGVPLDQQDDASRLWIADEFTTSELDHGAIIVHGHTINMRDVVITPNRICVDTGAYLTGRLSAIAIEDDQTWVVTTMENFRLQSA